MRILRSTAPVFFLLFACSNNPKLSGANSVNFNQTLVGKNILAATGSNSQFCVIFGTKPNSCLVFSFSKGVDGKMKFSDSGKGLCSAKTSATGKYFELSCKSDSGGSCISKNSGSILVNLNAAQNIEGNEKVIKDADQSGRLVDLESQECANLSTQLKELAEKVKKNTPSSDNSKGSKLSEF